MPDRAKNVSHPRLISDPVPPVLLSNSALPGETDRHFVRGVEGYRNHPWRQRLEHTPPRLRALGVVTGRGGSRVRGEKRFTGDCTHRFCGRAHFPSCSKANTESKNSVRSFEWHFMLSPQSNRFAIIVHQLQLIPQKLCRTQHGSDMPLNLGDRRGSTNFLFLISGNESGPM